MRKLLITTVVFSAFLFCSCNKGGVKHTVQYFISGESIMNVSFTDINGDLLSKDNVSSAWVYAFNAPGNKRIVELIVNSTDGSPVGGSIFIDGEEASLGDSNTGSLALTAQLP